MCSSTCYPQWTLVDTELDTGRRMDRGRGGRHEAWGHAARGTTGVQPEARARVRGVRREMQGARRKALMKVRGVRREMWCT